MQRDPESETLLTRFCKALALFSLSALLLGLAVFLAYTHLGSYDDFYDSGVYAESARMMIRGGHLYSSIFDSQPPLWLLLVASSFRLFGNDFFAGQLLSATMGLLVILAVGVVAWQVSDWPGALAAAATVALSPIELQWSRTISPEIASSAFAVVGMAYAFRYLRTGGRCAIALASSSVAASILIKLLGIFTIPALFLAVGFRHCKTYRSGYAFWLPLAQDTLLVIGTLVPVIIGVSVFFGPAQVWDQAVRFHWAARSAISPDTISRPTSILGQLFANDLLLAPVLCFGILGMGSIPEGIILGGWITSTMAGLFFHRPLFSHHLVFLIPGIAIAAGLGWSHFWHRFFRRMLIRGAWQGVHGINAACSSLLILLLITLALVAIAARQISRQVYSVRHTHEDEAAAKIARLIAGLTEEDAAILTDAQGIAFLADRDVPPQLCDTSLVRIAAGYLTTTDVIKAAERSDVQLFLSWNGRLSLLPGMVEWAGRRFPYRVALGEGRELFSMRRLDRREFFSRY